MAVPARSDRSGAQAGKGPGRRFGAKADDGAVPVPAAPASAQARPTGPGAGRRRGRPPGRARRSSRTASAEDEATLHPKHLLYTARHVWVKVDQESGVATAGITEPLAEQLPEILSIDMPMVGDELEMDADCIHLHLPGRLRGLPSPLTGRVVAINRDVLDTPQLLHLSPYESWLIRMEYDEPDEVEMLMSVHQYSSFVDSL